MIVKSSRTFVWSSNVPPQAYGVYELEILESQRGTELFYIDVTSGGRSVTAAASKARRCDVAITVTSADLAAVLSGASSPLQVGPSNIYKH